MTATEELRCMLDARGITWWSDEYCTDPNTCWRFGDFEWRALERCDELFVTCACTKYLTSAQAVETMLRFGTCHMETVEDCQNWHSCSECDADYYTDQPLNYCPNCGRRVVE